MNAFLRLCISELAKVNKEAADRANWQLFNSPLVKATIINSSIEVIYQDLIAYSNDQKPHILKGVDAVKSDFFFKKYGRQLRNKSLGLHLPEKRLTEVLSNTDCLVSYAFIRCIIANESLRTEYEGRSKPLNEPKPPQSLVSYCRKVGFTARKMIQFIFVKSLRIKYGITLKKKFLTVDIINPELLLQNL